MASMACCGTDWFIMGKLNNSILFVHPLGYKTERASQDVSRIANIMPPLGLASMAAYLKQKNIDADIVDCYAKPFSDRFIKDYLAR